MLNYLLNIKIIIKQKKNAIQFGIINKQKIQKIIIIIGFM